jgi:hypothetical protein
MIIARHQTTPAFFSGRLPHLPQRHVRQLRDAVIGVIQYGLIAAAMFGVSAVAGVLAGVAVGVLG